jgi:putative DNA primase/helicase
MGSQKSALSVEQEGQRLVERLGGRWGSDGGMCRCPAHDDRIPSLSVRPGRTRLLLHCFAGCAASAILRSLEADRLLEPGAASEPRSEFASARRAHDAAALRLWDDARSIEGTPAEAYLELRGISARSAQLRYHSSAPFGPRPLTELRPALLAAVRDQSGLVAVHRSFIDPGTFGLAPVSNPRRGLGRFGSGAVRLGGISARLGLAEGIETALSATALFGVPCWATLGTERFGRIALPPEVCELVLFLDHDCGGRRAERLARETFGHIPRLKALYPERAGEDWNDVLRSRLRERKGGGRAG